MIELDFLYKVWAHTCEVGDNIFLSTKKGALWKEHCFTFSKHLKRELREWFSRYPTKNYDIYFCPLAFRGKERKKTLVKPTNLLWSDIDEGTTTIDPTLLWESSPGRLQALWYLDEKLNPHAVEELNQALTKHIHADPGGWDLTQVLRVPGTLNHKYSSLPKVRLLQDTDVFYCPKNLAKKLGVSKKVEEPETNLGSGAEEILSKYRKEIPLKVKKLLAQKTIGPAADRSDTIWYIENKLSEAGMKAPEIIEVIKHSIWNKYKDRSDESIRLKNELEKIIENKVEQPTEKNVELIVESYSEVLSSSDSSPGWLVQDFWMNQSHGIVAGEPKSFKSTLALDMAISVASGKPFLGKEVINPGSVVYIQNENSKWIMKDRMLKIAASKGLGGKVKKRQSLYSIEWAPDIPLFMINQQSFLLTDTLHQKLLEQLFEQYKPSLIILDPLYLMFDGDINSAKDLNPILNWLIEMRYKFKCGIMLIHHYNKGSTQKGGQRMLGSTTLHGWIESAWYMSSEETKITMEREFRGSGSPSKIDIKIAMGEIGSFDYSTTVSASPEEQSLEEEIVNNLRMKKGGILQKTLADSLGYPENKISSSIDLLVDKGKVRREGRRLLLIEH